MAKKKVAKKKPVKSAEQHFVDWWLKVAVKKVAKIEKNWCKKNEPNDPDDEGGGDDWYVNQMMHDGEASNMCYENALPVFTIGFGGKKWEMSQSDSLYCELDDIIAEAYTAGKKAKSSLK
jgi:hypothetical protein